MSINSMQATVCAVTARAKSARSAPAHPAPDAGRWQRASYSEV